MKAFVVTANFRTSPGSEERVKNYLYATAMGFNSWGQDHTRAKRFDTRALAKRYAVNCGISRQVRIETVDA